MEGRCALKKLILVSVLFVSACAGGPPVYHKDGENQQQFMADQSECNARAEVFDHGGFYGLAAFLQQKEMCMAGKGYTCTQGEKPCS